MRSPLETQSIRIVIVDDQTLFRQGLRKILEEQPDMEVVAELSDGRGVLGAVETSRADLLLLDLEVPGLDGYEILRQLRTSGKRVSAIVLTSNEDRIDLSMALELGAGGILSKRAATTQLLIAIREVYQGVTWLDDALQHDRPGHVSPNDLAEDLIVTQRSFGVFTHASDEPTPRETEIAGLVTQGLRYKEIARRLTMSPHTLNNHLRHIFEKLQVRGRVELAIYGTKRNL